MMELYNLVSHFSLSFLLNNILFITNLIIFISFFLFNFYFVLHEEVELHNLG